jgi:hypothetical protein
VPRVVVAMIAVLRVNSISLLIPSFSWLLGAFGEKGPKEAQACNTKTCIEQQKIDSRQQSVNRK